MANRRWYNPLPTGRKKPKNMSLDELQKEATLLDCTMSSGDYNKNQNKRMFERQNELIEEIKRRIKE